MPQQHITMIVGSGMHLMARCPICGDLGSMLRHEEGTPASLISSFLSRAESSHKKDRDPITNKGYRHGW